MCKEKSYKVNSNLKKTTVFFLLLLFTATYRHIYPVYILHKKNWWLPSGGCRMDCAIISPLRRPWSFGGTTDEQTQDSTRTRSTKSCLASATLYKAQVWLISCLVFNSVFQASGSPATCSLRPIVSCVNNPHQCQYRHAVFTSNWFSQFSTLSLSCSVDSLNPDCSLLVTKASKKHEEGKASDCRLQLSGYLTNIILIYENGLLQWIGDNGSNIVPMGCGLIQSSSLPVIITIPMSQQKLYFEKSE